MLRRERGVAKIRVARREGTAAAAEGEEPAPKANASVLHLALRDARAVLPSRDPRENGRGKQLFTLGWGVPVTHASVAAYLLSLREPALRGLVEHPLSHLGTAGALMAVLFVLPLVIPWLTAFLATAGFYALQGRSTRSRLRQALVCPYCRDEVGSEGALICARKGCGALYHRECWDECAMQYGGCAVYGCSSKKANEVTASGYILRIARLAVAAALFTPKIAQAIRRTESEGFLSIYRRAAKATKLVGVSNDPEENKPYKMAIHVGLSFGMVATAIVLSGVSREFSNWLDATGNRILIFLALVAIPIGLPWALALPPTLVFFTFRALAVAFKSELAALLRADEGGGSVLGRLRAGGGKKCDH
jgi:hypothetical protein